MDGRVSYKTSRLQVFWLLPKAASLIRPDERLEPNHLHYYTRCKCRIVRPVLAPVRSIAFAIFFTSAVAFKSRPGAAIESSRCWGERAPTLAAVTLRRGQQTVNETGNPILYT